jgi:flagellar hook-associated protein 3 FlgL
MISSLDPTSNQFLDAMRRIAAETERATREISSGIRISQPSDSPDEVSEVLSLEAALARVDQVQKNLGRVKAEVDTAESSLSTASQILEQILSLGTQGANGTLDAANRSILAEQVASLQKQLVDVSRTAVDGQYIFSGDQDGTPPYQYNAAQPNGVDRLSTAAATRVATDANGAQFTYRMTATEIFDHRDSTGAFASDNIFVAVNQLQIALAANDPASVESALSLVKESQSYLERKIAFYGNAQNRVDAAVSGAEKVNSQLTTRLSEIRDADIPAAAVQLTQARVQQQAALSAQAQFPRTSLFDYLK